MVSLDLFRKFFALSFMLCVVGASLPVHAATAIDTACDPTFLDRLRERAWGEAQREMMTNQKMIWKPDSVLALGCYEQWIDNALPVHFTKDSGSNLSKIKNFAKNNYLDVSFKHNLGGGNLGGSNTSNCSNIKTLWESSLCSNLSINQFFSLGGSSAGDSRYKPVSKAFCNTNNVAPTSTSWTSAKDVMTKLGANSPFNKMDLFTKVVAPLSETSPVKCSAGIPTGVMLNGGSNPEVVCPNPGCSPDGKAAPKCCKSGTAASCS